MPSLLRRHRFAILGFALAIPLAIQAGPPPGGEPGHPSDSPGKAEPFDAGDLPPHLQKLGLSEAQRTQVVELFKTQGAGLREKLEAGKKGYKALQRLALSPGYSDEKAKVLSEESIQRMAEAALDHARLDHAVYQLLTPAQRQQLSEWFAQMDQHLPPR